MSAPGGLSRSELEVARKQLDEAATISGALVEQYPTVPLYAASRALIFDRLGELHEQLRQGDEAERHYQKAVALQAALARQHPDVAAYDLTLARLQRSLARMLTGRKEYKEARVLLEGSAERLEILLKRTPTLVVVRVTLGRTQHDLADVLARLGETALAAKAQRRAEELGPDRGGVPFGPPPN
jgi:tetratricopeptide (TPR) repeat protein